MAPAKSLDGAIRWLETIAHLIEQSFHLFEICRRHVFGEIHVSEFALGSEL
jgi:hypothetical protein